MASCVSLCSLQKDNKESQAPLSTCVFVCLVLDHWLVSLETISHCYANYITTYSSYSALLEFFQSKVSDAELCREHVILSSGIPPTKTASVELKAEVFIIRDGVLCHSHHLKENFSRLKARLKLKKSLSSGSVFLVCVRPWV